MMSGSFALPLTALLFAAQLETATPQIARAAQRSADERLLRSLQVPTEGPGLVEFLRWQHLVASQKTLPQKAEGVLEVMGWQRGPKTLRQQVALLLPKLGDDSFRVRDQAFLDLAALGPAALPLTDHASKFGDLLVQRRLKKLREVMVRRQQPDVIGAALRMVGHRRPAGATAALFQYLPVANELVEDEALAALWELGMTSTDKMDLGKMATTDSEPTRRAAAALVLGRFGNHQEREVARGCLQDTNSVVRLRAAQGLLAGGDRSAMTPLLDLLANAPLPIAEKAEDILLRLAGNSAPLALYPNLDPNVPNLPNTSKIYSEELLIKRGGKGQVYYDPQTPQTPGKLQTLATNRAKYRDGWADWWKARHSQRLGLPIAQAGPRSGLHPQVRVVAEQFIQCLNVLDAATFRRVTDVPFMMIGNTNQNLGMQPGGVLATRAQVDQFYTQTVANSNFGLPIVFKKTIPAVDFAKKASPAWRTFLETYRHNGMYVVAGEIANADGVLATVFLAVCVRGADVRVVAYQVDNPVALEIIS